MDLTKIEEFKEFIHTSDCRTKEKIIKLCKSCDEQYLKITYPNNFKTIYIYVETITFVNLASILIYGPVVTFVNIDNDELRFTYDLHGVVTVLFSEHPSISILSKRDFINQVNQIKNSYINF